MRRQAARDGGDLTATEYRRRQLGPATFRHAAPKKGKRKRRSPLWTKFALVFGIVFILLSATGIGAKIFLTERYDHNIKRDDLLGANRHGEAPIEGPLNFLLLGTDKRTEADFDPNDPSSNTWTTPGPARADTIMLVHVPRGSDSAYVISIPRDAYINVPSNEDIKNPEIEWGGGKTKINAAYAYGGAPLMVTTLQEFTGLTIDYPILLNFKAVRQITDAVGGVDVTVDRETQDYRTLEKFPVGKQHLNGNRADAFVRQRKEICSDIAPVTDPKKKGAECALPRGDYDRQARQQQYIRALSVQITKKGINTNPKKLDKLLRIITKNVTVDKSMPVQKLMFSLKHLSQNDLTFLSLPMIGGEKNSYGEWIEVVDEAKSAELFKAVENETLPDYIAQYGKNDPTHGR